MTKVLAKPQSGKRKIKKSAVKEDKVRTLTPKKAQKKSKGKGQVRKTSVKAPKNNSATRETDVKLQREARDNLRKLEVSELKKLHTRKIAMTQVRRFFREVYMEEIKPSAPLRMSEEAALALHQIFEHWIRGILEAAWTMCKADNRHTLQAKHLDTLHAVLRCSQSLFRYDPSVEKVVLQPGLNDSPIEWDVQRNEVQEETPAKKIAKSTKQKNAKKTSKSVSISDPEISFECESDQESEASSENIVF